ncbi:MAG: hypothetical protein V1484_01560 [bacterium]
MEKDKRSHISKRKALKKAVAERLGVPVDWLTWVNGQLFWAITKKPVEGVLLVPKPAKPKLNYYFTGSRW